MFYEKSYRDYIWVVNCSSCSNKFDVCRLERNIYYGWLFISYFNHSEERHSYVHVLVSSALIGLFLSIAFSWLDLILDHYQVIKGVPDGRFLTLGETLSEFSDDLFIIALIVMFSVTIISFIVTVIYSKMFGKKV